MEIFQEHAIRPRDRRTGVYVASRILSAFRSSKGVLNDGVEHVVVVKLSDGVAAALLIGASHERIERQRILVWRREALLQRRTAKGEFTRSAPAPPATSVTPIRISGPCVTAIHKWSEIPRPISDGSDPRIGGISTIQATAFIKPVE